MTGEALYQSLLYGSVPFAFGVFVTSSYGLKIPGFRRIYHVLQNSFLSELIQTRPTWQLGVLALSAGVGEEVLFRCAVQTYLGLWLTAVLFGALHALTFTYFVVAVAVGAYLGAIWVWADGNLFVPVLVHTVYDFFVFLLYRRRMRIEAGS